MPCCGSAKCQCFIASNLVSCSFIDYRAPFSELLNHAWFKAKIKPSKSKKPAAKTNNCDDPYDGFDYDETNEDNKEMRANNGNDVVTKKKQKKVVSKKVIKAQKTLKDMKNENMPTSKVDLINFFHDHNLQTQGEKCDLVDLACKDGFGNEKFKKFCSNKVKNCHIYTGVNQYEEPQKKKKSTQEPKKKKSSPGKKVKG